MRWSSAAEPEAVDLPTDDTDEVTALRRALDAASPGPVRAEVAHLLAAAYEKIGEEEGALAALRICIDNAVAGPLVGTAWRRLVELFARRGDPHAAARALIASADDPRVGRQRGRTSRDAGGRCRDPAQAAGAARPTQACCSSGR